MPVQATAGMRPEGPRDGLREDIDQQRVGEALALRVRGPLQEILEAQGVAGRAREGHRETRPRSVVEDQVAHAESGEGHPFLQGRRLREGRQERSHVSAGRILSTRAIRRDSAVQPQRQDRQKRPASA